MDKKIMKPEINDRINNTNTTTCKTTNSNSTNTADKSFVSVLAFPIITFFYTDKLPLRMTK